ncbi:MAG TPA: hypothetical protein VKA53_09045 [Thermoanaerobaculia bacterium]|nr:hypothetical protein [Thermoanaerobaculia bacterium]
MIDFDQAHLLVQEAEGPLVGDFLERLDNEHHDWYVGACLLLPRWFVSTYSDRAALLEPDVNYLLGDPDTRRLHLAFEGRGRARSELDYLGESDPLANRKRFVRNTLRAQVANGRQTLISPWMIHGLSGDERYLEATVEFASIAAEHKLAKGRQLLMGLEATQEIFADKESRDRMVDEVIEGDAELPIYLRMTIDPPESRRPFGDAESLRGLREAVEAFRDNDRRVILPQSGLCGYLMLPFGASAFGAGRRASMERNLRPSDSSGGGGGAPPLNWYFSFDLLGPVLAEELVPLHAAGVPVCGCPYCDESPPEPGLGFDADQAAKHFLYGCASLAEEVRQAGDPAAVVRNQVATAVTLWAQIREAGVALDNRSQENHLAAWSAAIS